MLNQYLSSGAAKIMGIEVRGVGDSSLGTDIRAQVAGEAMSQAEINHLTILAVTSSERCGGTKGQADTTAVTAVTDFHTVEG